MATERKTCRNAFTLVDLIFILAIIVILVVMIVPSMNRAVLLGRKNGHHSFVQELSGAAQSYCKDTNFYPGIRYPRLFAGNRDADGKQTGGLTGSQVLAASVFGLYYKGVDDGDPNNDGITKTKPGTYTANVYVSYTKAKVIDEINFLTPCRYFTGLPCRAMRTTPIPLFALTTITFPDMPLTGFHRARPGG
ncbi:MAG: hypothetical protein HZA50_17240 [Planctomycetes bacterium]|nr:hypothetical protein [Planctomycetota bacterium]